MFVVIVLCYSVMNIRKDLYGPMEVIDLAKDLYSGSSKSNRKLMQWKDKKMQYRKERGGISTNL